MFSGYKKTNLDNGLKIASLSMHGMESVSLGIWINAGGRYEEEKFSGISHFLEHLVFRGTKTRTARQIKESIEGLGGMLNAFTAEEFTCYLTKIPAKHLGIALDVLSDMVKEARLSVEDAEKERMVILEEIKMYMDLPSQYVHELLNQLLWPGQPLGMSLSGTPDTVSKMSVSDIKSYRDKFYQPQHISIIACGALDDKKLIDLSLKHFKYNKYSEKISAEKANMKLNGPRTNFYFKETEQTHISLGTHALRRNHKDRYVLTLLHIILGANMSSRLFQEVREKRGLAYEIGTHIMKLEDTGAFIVNAGVEHKKAPQAVKVIMEQLSKIKDKPVTYSEFRRAKEYLTGQFLLALEDTMDHMLWLGENVAALDKIHNPEEVLKELDKITVDDLRRVANDIFKTKDVSFALIGNIKDKDRRLIENFLVL